jgi:hypothetical protein
MDAGTSPSQLPWPPLAEDLERLYLEQKLSASKIAAVYGLKYASAKTAESTILYHLKKNGIARRDPAAHVKKVTDSIVDDWMVRYQKGESLKQIAAGQVGLVTVFNRLHKRGVQLRDKVEAQIKAVTIHPKKSFSGDPIERAYLAGFAFGDLGVVRHGRAIRVKLGTTHPAMSTLFRNVFEPYGPIYEYPRKAPLTGHEWLLDCDLDSSFDFLLMAKTNPMKFVTDERTFWAFLAGFFDAEGSVYYHRKERRGAFELAVVNLNLDLLRELGGRLRSFGFSFCLQETRVDTEKAAARGIMNSSEFIWRIAVWRYRDVQGLLKRLPLKHPEKVAKAGIASRLAFRAMSEHRRPILDEWESLIRRIDAECKNYIEKASVELEKRDKTITETRMDSI